MFKWLKDKFISWKRKRDLKKRLEEIRKKDPFIYK